MYILYICMYVLSLLIECERPTLLRTNNLDGKQQHLGGDEKRNLLESVEERGKHLESKGVLIFKMYYTCRLTCFLSCACSLVFLPRFSPLSTHHTPSPIFQDNLHIYIIKVCSPKIVFFFLY